MSNIPTVCVVEFRPRSNDSRAHDLSTELNSFSEKDMCRCAGRKCDVIAAARWPARVRCPRSLTGKCNGDNRYSLSSSCDQRQCAKASGIQKDIQHMLYFQGIYSLGNILGYLQCLSFWKTVLNNLYLFGYELESP